MKGKKIILRIVLVLIALIVVASLYFYFTLPHWKGIYIGGVGLFLTINPVSYTHLDVYKRQSQSKPQR